MLARYRPTSIYMRFLEMAFPLVFMIANKRDFLWLWNLIKEESVEKFTRESHDDDAGDDDAVAGDVATVTR